MGQAGGGPGVAYRAFAAYSGGAFVATYDVEVTEHDRALRDWIRRKDAETRKAAPNRDPLYSLMLELGEIEPSIPRPRGVRRTRCTYCYRCAWNTLTRHPELPFIIVGFALRPRKGP